MKRIILIAILCLQFAGTWAQQREITLSGYVEDAFLKTPLLHAQVSVCRTDSTVLVDSATVMPFGEFVNGELKLKSTKFTAMVLTSDKTLLWHVQMKGYNDVWQRVNIGKADNVDVPTTGLRKARETQMGEVVVKATRVKMFYRGDTIVYNADAFNLPQGSMLDDLIRQMPGVTMNESGEIFVNGRKVDELLLGSQSFMRGKKQVLMENLPYYTVKNIKVYDKRSDKSEALGYDVEPKKFVMDVNLKDESRNGYIANVELAGGGSLYKSQTPQPPKGGDKPRGGSLSQGDCLPLKGAGGSGHWLGRAFLLGFTDRTRLTLFGNINNVNETRHIGESDRWSPARMPSSMTTTRSAAAEFFYHSDKVKETLNADFTFTTNTTDMHQRREQFLQGSTPLSTSSSWDRGGTHQLKLHNSLSLTAPLWGLHNLDFYHLTRDGSFHSAFDQWSDTLVASKRSIGMSEGKAWGIKAESQGAFNLNKEKQQHMDFFLVLAYDRDESQQANRYETKQFATKQTVATHNSDDLLNSSLNGLLLLSTGRKIGKGMHVGI
ncbi:MAG: hypothetical protein KBT39_00030, partial [Bacteroidales bacterium]|nr:hypothetical protein [Bacteroidales bacterium]